MNPKSAAAVPAGVIEIPAGAITPGSAPVPTAAQAVEFREDLQAHLAAKRPLVVQPTGPGTYEIVVGRLHWETARTLGWTHISAVVIEPNYHTMRRLRYLETLSLLPDGYYLRAGWAARRLLDRTGWSQAALARLLPVGESTLSDWLKAGRLLPRSAVRQAAGEAGVSFGRLAALSRDRQLRPLLEQEDPAASLNEVAHALHSGRPVAEVLSTAPSPGPPVRLAEGAVQVCRASVGTMPVLQVLRLAIMAVWTLIRVRFTG